MATDGHEFTRIYPDNFRHELMRAIGRVNAEPFLGFEPRSVMLSNVTCNTVRGGRVAATLSFCELDAVASPGVYNQMDFNYRLLERRRSWCRRLATWIKGRTSKFGVMK